MKKSNIEYTVYKGENIIATGTRKECAEILNTNPETITFYATPTHMKRIEKRKKPENAIVAVRIDLDEL